MKLVVHRTPRVPVLLLVMAAGLAGAVTSAQSAREPQKRPPVLTAATGPGSLPAATTTALFAQVAVGGGYITQFTFMNTGATALTGRLYLTADNGNPFNVALSEPSPLPEAPSAGEFRGYASDLDLGSIPPGGTKFINAGPVNASDPVQNGWARVESEGGSLGGVATFQYTEVGTLKTIAGVLSAEAVEFATIPVDNDDASQRYTGFAVANNGSESINIKLVTVDESGQPKDSLTPTEMNPLAAGKQFATFLHQLASQRVTFKGSMVLIAQGGKRFAVVALVQNQGLLTAIPVIPSKAPGIN